MSDNRGDAAGRSPGLRAAGHGRDRRGGAPAPGLGRPAAQARTRARRAVPGPLAGGRPRRRPGRGPAHGRRRHLHRSRRAGRVRAGRRRRRQEGHAVAAALVRRLGHPPDEPVGLRGQPRAAHRRRPPAGAGAPGRGPAACRAPASSSSPPRRGRTPGGWSPPPPHWPRRPAVCCTPPAATAGWSAGSQPPAATPTASIPAPTSSTRAELGALDLRGETRGRAPARRGRGRPRGHRAERDGGGDGAAASAPSCSRAIGTRLAPGGTLVIHSVTRASLGSARRTAPRPTWRRAVRCGPRRGAGCWRRAATRPRPSQVRSGADYLVTAVRAGLATPYAPAER